MSLLAVLAVAVGCAALAAALTRLARAAERDLAAARVRRLGEIMRQLDDGRWHYGLAMVKASGGALTRGLVYVDLRRLEEAGLVESRLEDPAPPRGSARRVYRRAG